MARTTYSPQIKAKLVLEVLSGERKLVSIAHENEINPNMLQERKREFLDKASTVFEDPAKAEKEAKRGREEAEEGE